MSMSSLSKHDDDKKVLSYLKHVAKSIHELAYDADTVLDADLATDAATADPSYLLDGDSSSTEYYMDKITRMLLAACDPMSLSKPVKDSLILTLYDPKGKEKPTRIKSRIDALRNIYRTMAPIALDVAARISILVSSSGGGGDGKKEQEQAAVKHMCTKAFCAYAVWLPIAPQMAQIVMDLFQSEHFVSPLYYVEDCTGTGTGTGIGKNGENEMDVDVITTVTVTANSSSVGDDRMRAIATFSEAAFLLVGFFSERGDHVPMKELWDWTNLFTLLGCHDDDYDNNNNNRMDVEMKDEGDDDDDDDVNHYEPSGWAQRPYSYALATRWFTARAVGNLLNLTPTSKAVYIQGLGLEEEMVPWVLHPWIILDEEIRTQNNQLKGVISLVQSGKEVIVDVPDPAEIRQNVLLPSLLVHLGQGIVMPRKCCSKSKTANQVSQSQSSKSAKDDNNERQGLVMTATTSRNLALLGTALCSDPYPPPILVCGPRGSGKSSLIRELANYCSAPNSNSESVMDDLLELHVDEETDSKTLLGSYAATDIPGEFTWRPGALTNAVRQGKWVLLEDVESCPAEIQAALVKLFEERVLPLGIGKSEKCHPSFRMFGTCTTSSFGDVSHQGKRRLRKGVSSAGSGGKRLIHPGLWRKVHVDPLPYSELQIVSRGLFPSLPEAVSDAALNVLRKLDKSGRSEDSTGNIDDTAGNDGEEKKEPGGGFTSRTPLLGIGRHSSVRDLVKLLARISSTVHFEPGATFCTESQRILCMAESFDIFASWSPRRHLRSYFVTQILAPIWGITSTLAIRYVEDRQPQIQSTSEYVEVGRSTVRRPPKTLGNTNDQDKNFAETNYALRLMESVGVCISQNEPTLLVGETGCGKTTLIQRLAYLSGHELVVQNLSLQTDSTDLLGGYRPLEIRHIARLVYTDFVQLFCSSFSKSQNAQFLDYVTAAYEKGQWKRLAQCFLRAAKMGLDKTKQQKTNCDTTAISTEVWFEFKRTSERFEKQRVACDTGLAFVFTEGALVEAIRSGKWVLLDEINLASSETLERLCGLLDDAKGSVTLTEKGDSETVRRHPDFRIFAAMNPATDAGKKDLPSSLRSRFTEIYVDELIDPVELRFVAARYLSGVIAPSETPLEHTESVVTAVDVYIKCRQLSEQSLVDGGGQRPRYTLRTMCRALSAARNLMLEQKFSVKRALLEGYELGFEGALDIPSRVALRKLLNSTLGKDLSPKEVDHPGRKPGGRSSSNDNYILSKPFWLKAGLIDRVDWSEASPKSKRSRFVLTPSMTKNLRRLSQAVAAGPWPVLLEGPTSAGKTTMVEYLAARCGHRCVRINNHEHTDVQEYTGSYASDSNGRLCFQEGILVQALRNGHWVILDELNLAPSEVLEALNRLLDDNRELYLAEINEVVKPHPNFRLFATQNPSGAYGGRKPLSRAFRNRFVEIHVGDIPEKEMITILELRCHCPPSHAKLLVNVMSALRKRRSKSGVFRGKDGLITPRDLLRWAERKAATKEDLAINGYMLLAERLRDEEEKILVKEIIEEHLKIEINCDQLYYGDNSESRKRLAMITRMENSARTAGLTLEAIAPTKSLLRLLTLVERCVEQKEPVLLVGETGCGKTTVVQLLSVLFDRELGIVNCHASTETSDLLGGLRPLRGRKIIMKNMVEKMRIVVSNIEDKDAFASISIPNYLKGDSEKAPDNASAAIACLSKEVRSAGLKCASNVHTNSNENVKPARFEKRRKLENGGAKEISNGDVDISAKEISYGDVDISRLTELLDEVDVLAQHHASLFEWVDGPLVGAMRKGHLFLLDEMSLAEDAVLERLNSVLEPSRTLVLAEKGGDLSLDEDSDESTEVKAHDDFRVFATMNPGGDFGKRELSPALRSRFTEIWVPSVTESSDIELVLGQTLQASLQKYHVQHISESCLVNIKQNMLNYVIWFNNDICSKPMSTFTDFVLSLRDVLAWARFVMETSCNNKELSIWSAYAHGASLMHLDGLGLGTGLSHEEASETKATAKTFLHNAIPDNEERVAGFEDEYECIDDNALYINGNFGVHPFMIPTGEVEIPNKLGFKLSAPTTGMNLRRVLRAMQISKPILLEGSPGVGKTSLISALAAASGHHLVRINLSEQTDISDLMGSDLPMPEETTDENGNTSAGGSFKWCDGALLKAIKNGDWVLLDELNLASQSVLEGLNSCLDHRASVYIPELGQTFDCPPTFRIFAAQNPLAQGGGRKGLPKSFLNRFTKVYVEALTKGDLQGIVTSKFPMLPPSLVENIVRFNDFVQADIANRMYGQLGSPWEFNLRDVFRWCDLIRNHYTSTGQIEYGAFSDTIYMQRLRSDRDRSLLAKRYEDCFGNRDCIRNDPRVDCKENVVRVGIARLDRNVGILPPSDSIILGSEPSLLRNLVRPMEAVALCVQMGWACLLVGPPASGKTTILKSLAESCNRQLEEIALTPSSDVNELIGTFEQIDAAEVEARLCNNLKDISNFACLTLTTGKAQLKLLEEISSAYYSLVSRMNYLKKSQTSPVVINEKQPMKLVDKLLSSANMASTICDSFKQSCARMILSASKDISSFKSSNKTTDSNAVHFRWFDGVLVQALEKGYWLHLENVNFCPSSVLDRLNPLMEIGGELVLTECGINDDENGTAGTSRVIKAHPNFRLFLSMNPAFGEVSRAMRNRCIEVSLLAPPVSSIGTTRTDNEDPTAVVTSTETLDALDTLFGAGVRSTPLAMAMIKSHLEEFHGHDMAPDDCQPSRNLDELARLSLDSSRRGQNGKSCLSLPLQIAYEIHHEEFMENDGIEDSLRNGNMFEMVEKLFPRHMLERLSTFNSVAKDARLLKTMHDAGDDCLPLGLTSFNQKENLSDEKSLIFNRFASTLVAEDPRIPSIRTYIVANYIRKSQEQDMHLRTRYFDGYSQQISSVMKILGNHFFDANSSSISGHFFTAVCSDRLAQILDERATEINLFDFDAEEHDPSALSIIELSFCIHENKIDRTNVSCPVTPILHPFFISLDSYLDNLQASSLDTAILGRVLEAIAALFESRDRMWKFLKQSHVLPNSSFLGFDESGFLVHWTWLKKRLDSFSAATSSLDNPQFASARRDIDLIVATIDQAVHNQSGDMRLANAFWKRIGHPLVPAKAEDAEAIIGLKNASKTFALLNDEDFGYLRLLSGTSSNISIKTLFELQHDSLLYGPEAKSETLTALSMAYWATTDEMNASTRNERKNYDVVQVNDMLSRKLISAKEEFRTKIQACTIDTDINTVENKLDLEDLEALREEQSREGAEDIMQNLLTTFGTLQLTQLAEFVCIREEEWIIDTMAMLVKEPTPNALMVIAKLRDEVLQRIKDFISTVINDTIWPVSDLRPYQSIVWVIESLSNDVQPIRRLFGSCYSTLIATLSRHHWCNSFNDMNSIAESIESPSFWSIKSSECNKNSDFDDKHEAVAGLLYYSGVPRTNQNVATEFLFRIQGFKRVADASSQAIPYLTLENQEARFGQSRKLANFLSQDLIALRTKTRPSSTLQYLFHNMVEALCDSFECDEDFSTFRDAIQCADGTASSYLVNCKHRTFTKIAEAFLAPLLNTLQKVEHSYSPEAFSEALIYIGILRFHLTLPASPLDPGKKPGAKVAQWDQHLQDLGSKLVTMRMESGLDTGNFDPDNEEVSLVLGALSHCGKKRSKQEKKRVERPRNSPPFYDLFREVHHFAGTVANVDNIAGLVQAISNDASGESYPSNRQKEVNWQSSAVAFHNQITAKYSCFDDVISPCLAALGMIQNGLRGLIHLKGNQEKSFTVATMNLQDHLLQYPNVKLATSFDPMALHDISKSFRASTEINKERFLTEKMEKNSQLSYLLATLANICILRVRRAVSETEFNRVSSYIFAAIADAWNSSSSSTSIEDTKDESDEEKKERQYREQFPDHAKEFNKIIEAVEAIELGGEHYEEEDYNADGSKINEFSVSEEQLSFICDIHKELFSGQNKGSNSDSLRIKSFIATYAAAAQLNNSIVLVDSLEPENKRLGAHCFALGLNAKNDSGSSLNFHSFMKSDTSVDTDFHKDPNPAEVLKADLPLRGLLLRISKLMRAFPGNSILIAIGQVVETMRQMDVKDTSLGKMLTGLEVILKKAQEWEQHASKRVALGESLQRISRLVAQWRKLELQSWSSLLNVRDQTHILRAKRHWMRLYNILVSDEDKPRQDHDLVVSSGYSSPRFPKWLWIGQGKHLHHVTKNSMDTIHSEDHVEMLKVLDTFILTSGIGQFIERLELLQSFAEQLRAEYRIAQVKNDRRLSKALIVDSLVKHYSTFATMIATAKEILRKPIEKKLKDDVKLAKWDEQSYYALTDSAEKSHRKLMMIVHEYEEVLDMSVGRILEEHFLSGVRSNSEVGPGATNQPVTQIPSNSSIFPELKDDKSKPSNKDSSVAIFDAIAKLRIQKRQWVVPDFYPFIGNKMILGIPKYAKKMDRLFTASGDCHAILGQNNATEICDSIFERVNILREKGTKPMKERALVDLFKLLKKQGYSSMKWCVPREIREMTALFQIRSPSTSKLNAKNAEIVDNAESYFRRCTVEVSRLRSEVKMLGSAYMSKREMDLMVGFSEHGLLMLCQQRANLTKSIEDIKNVLNVLQVLDKVNGKLPSGQIHLFQRVQTFDCQYSVVMETIRQTFLMTKSIATLVEDNKSQCIDIIGIVEGGYSLLSDAYNPLNSKALVTSEDVDNIKIAKKQLEVTIYNISSCKEDNQRYRCFPQDAFNPCLDELRIALSHAESCIEDHLIPDSTSSSTPISNQLSEIVKSSLLAAQTLHDGFVQSYEDEPEQDQNDYLWENHSKVLCEWDTLNIQNLGNLLQGLVQGLQAMPQSNAGNVEGVCTDACVLIVKIIDMCQNRLTETMQFYRSVAKFEYVKLRLFRVVIAKGYCADDVEDGGDADGEGGDGNCTFEDDVEGTGMGEGEGKNDVTDQIENEEQLLGLKGDEEKEQQKEDQKQLDEEEAETGMEMENEFDGEMFDVPDKKDDENKDQDEDGEEELDREMGDGSDPNEQVVDEKMWDEDEDDDDEEKNQQEEEKFEKDSKMKGETMEDELRTKEDEEEGKGEEGKEDQTPENAGDNNHDEEAPKNDEDAQDADQDDKDRADDKEEDMVNNDFEEDYEDKHGVDIRDENEGQEPEENEDDAMDLNDEMNLDDGEDGEDAEGEDAGAQIGEEEKDGEDPEDQDDAGGNDNIDENPDAAPENEEDDTDMDTDAVQSAHQTLGDDDQMNADDEEKEEEKEEEQQPEQEPHDMNASDTQQEDAHGVAAKSGSDTVKRPQEEEDDENPEEGQGEEEEQDDGAGEGEEDDKVSGAGQSDANSGEMQDGEQGSGTKPSSTAMDAPNPFRDPGDAEKFWHKKLNVISDAQEDGAEEATTKEEEDKDNNQDETNPDGDFEFTSKEQDNSTQVLGGAAEEESTKLKEEDPQSKSQETKESETMESDAKDEELTRRQTKQEKSRTKESTQEEDVQDEADLPADEADNDQMKDAEMEDVSEESDEESHPDTQEDPPPDPENQIVTDLDQLQVRDALEQNYQTEEMEEEEFHSSITQSEVNDAREKWSELSAETSTLSRRLCEKLRLVMEPLVASKLRGDYRTGKRINMKRVIGYIASGYRKDKIWLRRTKPGKRDYRVLLAVDNSESMKNGAGEMALTALTTLANGMSQLDIGELGIASFGEEMKLLHPFHAPFTSGSGADVVSNFRFGDKRTRTALCVESAMAALESQNNGGSSMQLVFIISDGRVERDSRERLRRIVREMTEKNILVIMVIVEGGKNGKADKEERGKEDKTSRAKKAKDSIINMKEVSFDNGKPKVKHFIDDYPFPYYMVLEDMNTLPEVLGDALKQWFEMMAQNQSQG